jgi:hypothetical protein
VTSDDSNKTWGRNTVFRQEEFEDVKRNFKKKGCTWGPNSIQMKERTDGRERCVDTHHVTRAVSVHVSTWPGMTLSKCVINTGTPSVDLIS